LNLASRYDKLSLEQACQQGLAAHLQSYREIKGLLETPCADSSEGQAAHDNIRGQQYYQ